MVDNGKLISELSPNVSLDGTELFEIEKGSGPGSSQNVALSALLVLTASPAQGTKADTAVQTVVAGLGVDVDNTDPLHPIVTSSPQCIAVACSDETTPLIAGANKVIFRNPFATPFTVTHVKASLTTAQASGSILTIDILKAGVSIFSTELTIDNTEKTSETASTPAVVSDASLDGDAEISVSITQIGDGTATGLKVYIIGYA